MPYSRALRHTHTHARAPAKCLSVLYLLLHCILVSIMYSHWNKLPVADIELVLVILALDSSDIWRRSHNIFKCSRCNLVVKLHGCVNETYRSVQAGLLYYYRAVVALYR